MKDARPDPELESKVAFALEHSTTAADRDTLVQMLQPLESTRYIVDHSVGGDRLLLACLLVAGTGSGEAWQLLVLGCRSAVGPDAFSGFLEKAERQAILGMGSEGGTLDLVLPEALADMRELLKDRGYSEALAYLSLVAEVPSTPLAAGETAWRDVDASNVDAAYACYHDAFMATGAPVASFEEARAVLLESNPRPRLLFSDGHAAALVRVVLRDEPARTGELRFVCRSPQLRGQRLGDSAMSEVFRMLRGMGASRVRLDVASTNRAALDLYYRWGFRRDAEEAVFRITLHPR